ncbi:MAG: aldehyde dehydrogenase family protein [Acidobacteria bacterium]|nr:aldehyde dehydrogenase family protein [Acidobacteriota bacterium]
MPIASVNPATGETLRTFQPLTAAELEAKIALAASAYASHRKTALADRASKMHRAADILDARKTELSRMMTLEMGKPVVAARAEVEKCASVCRYYADEAASILAPEEVESDASKSLVRYDPIGPVLAIMPWNFPLWQVFRFAAPALMAGNVGLLKHAPNVPQCALVIEEIFHQAGFPEGVFQTLLVEVPAVETIMSDPRVMAATLTGSERAGGALASLSGKWLKKTVLELGGSDPFIVMPSADLEKAVKTGVTARTINNGQSCIAAKRFLVHKDIYEEFERRFVAGLEALKVGDPLDESTDIGPLVNEQILSSLADQVERTVQAGAKVLTGGKRLDRPGYFYPPTVLANIPKGSAADCEELFGPVASLFPVADIDEAIALANSTSFGLGSSAWTNDEAERERFVTELEAGAVFINGLTKSDPRLPFGGIKRSGYGRELSAIGMREFVNIKTVWIA